MERNGLRLVGPISGILFFATLIATMVATAGDPGVRPGDPGDDVAQYLADNRGEIRLAQWLSLLAAFFFVWFLADLRERLRPLVGDAGQWLLGVLWAGGLLLVAANLAHALVLHAQGTSVKYGADPHVAKTLLTLSWGRAVVMMPPIAAMMGAAALVSFRFRALPPWLGVLAVLGFLGALMPWVPVFALWVLATSVVLLARPGAPARTDSDDRAPA